MKQRDVACWPRSRLLRDSNTSEIGAKRKWLAHDQNATETRLGHTPAISLRSTARIAPRFVILTY